MDSPRTTGMSYENMKAVVCRVFVLTVTFKFLPAPPGVSKRADESEVQALIKNEVGPID